MIIQYEPIGVIHSPFKDVEGMPIQAAQAEDIFGTVDIDKQYREGLADLDGFSHLILIYHFHKTVGFNLKVVPFLDSKTRGLFATRAPKRPNAIGLSVVRLCKIEDTLLTVRGIDIVDGTPLLDIKPFVRQFDQPDQVCSGWIESVWSKEQRSDDRFR